MRYTSLSYQAEQVILGGLLGDSYLNASGSTILRLGHSIKQQEYLKWKVDMMREIFKSRIYTYSTKQGYTVSQASSVYHPFLDDCYKWLNLESGKKTVSRHYLNKLGPLALAVWWMDDGYCKVSEVKDYTRGNRTFVTRKGKLSTCCFSEAEHRLILNWLSTVYSITGKLGFETNGTKRYHSIYFNATNMKRLRLVIYPHVPACMSYKIDMKYSDPAAYALDYSPVAKGERRISSEIRNDYTPISSPAEDDDIA